MSPTCTDAAWLDRWIPLLREHVGGRPVLELGCGRGRDTQALSDAGFAVVALDIDVAAIGVARQRVPAARYACQDVCAPWPVDTRCGAVIASLSLHYFGWLQTADLAARIHAALEPGGLLVCRLNSTRDIHHGAVGHPEVEPGLFDVDGLRKRFFDRGAVERLLAPPAWRVLHLDEATIDRYAQPKVVWEAVAEAAFID
jgi:SAM-dependent methyltransferase